MHRHHEIIEKRDEICQLWVLTAGAINTPTNYQLTSPFSLTDAVGKKMRFTTWQPCILHEPKLVLGHRPSHTTWARPKASWQDYLLPPKCCSSHKLCDCPSSSDSMWTEMSQQPQAEIVPQVLITCKVKQTWLCNNGVKKWWRRWGLYR